MTDSLGTITDMGFHQETRQPPCFYRPIDWLQSGEAPNWEHLPRTERAIAACKTRCPRLRACARDALTIGTVVWDLEQQPAAGVVMAGIACSGDHATRVALLALLGTPVPDDHSACRRCERVFAGKNAVTHAAHGLCRGCYSTVYRARGHASPAARPSHCGRCQRPLTTRAKAKQEPECVVHGARGLCVTCHRAALRARATAASAAA